jgi:hypothetical protein
MEWHGLAEHRGAKKRKSRVRQWKSKASPRNAEEKMSKALQGRG